MRPCLKPNPMTSFILQIVEDSRRPAPKGCRSTPVEGVFAKGRRFIALLYIRGERRFLGSFLTLQDASAKVAKLKAAHNGEWAA